MSSQDERVISVLLNTWNGINKPKSQ